MKHDRCVRPPPSRGTYMLCVSTWQRHRTRPRQSRRRAARPDFASPQRWLTNSAKERVHVSHVAVRGSSRQTGLYSSAASSPACARQTLPTSPRPTRRAPDLRPSPQRACQSSHGQSSHGAHSSPHMPCQLMHSHTRPSHPGRFHTRGVSHRRRLHVSGARVPHLHHLRSCGSCPGAQSLSSRRHQ